MNKKLLLVLFVGLLVGGAVFAQDEEAANSSSDDAPWLKGVEHMALEPKIPAPLLDMTIGDENGAPLPTEITEDEPITVSSNSDIFFDYAPVKSIDGKEFYQAEWIAEKPVTLWHVSDWETYKTFLAPKKYDVAENQMVIIPNMPTGKASISCHCSRKMKYYNDEGKEIFCFANSSAASAVKVKDITPPTCGFEITVVGGSTGRLWPIENPPDHYPLPKTADMCFSGDLFNASEEDKIVQGYELGNKMIISNEDGGIRLSKDSVIKVKVIGDDNYKLDTDKIKYGVCAGAGGEPTPVSPVNEPEIDFTKFLIPENPYLYLDASDVAGNREILFIPLDIQ